MNKRGFTLIELLVVIAIMGMMGTASVGGYRQMQRGLEDSKVVDNVSRFVQLAAERAQIDRQPTAVYFWNELLRAETEEDPALVVGRAVAVKVKGRLTARDGSLLVDEFGDLEQFDEDGEYADAPDHSTTMRLYMMKPSDLNSGKLKYSFVRSTPQTKSGAGDYMPLVESYIVSDPTTLGAQQGKLIHFGYYLESGGTASDGEWTTGTPYGLEFQEIELPRGYVFKNSLPTSMSSPVREAATMVFDVDRGSTTGAAVGDSQIQIYQLRPGSSGTVQPIAIGTTTRPTTKLNNY